MHPSTRVLAAQARKPLIQFIGKRKWPSSPEPPHPHPQAPAEIKNAFGDFLKKMQGSVSASSSGSAASKSAPKPGVYQEFWEMPTRFWRYQARNLDEAEMDVITSGGARA